MRILLPVNLIIFLLMSSSVIASPMDEATHAVGLIVTYDEEGNTVGQGSGFFIDSKGTLVTNLHVLEGANSAIVKLDSGAFYTIGEYLGADENADIVILKAEGNNFPVIKMGDSSLANVGDEIVVIGNPMGLQNTISKGTISAIRDIEDTKIIQITAPISPGSSGGPLLNNNSEVIGITTFLVEGQNLNFAIPIEYATRALAASTLTTLGEDEMKKLENSATFLYIGGILNEDSENYDKAIEYYKKAIEQDGMLKEAYYHLEDIYYRKGMFKEEVEINERLVELFPDDYYAHYILGVACETIGKEDLAINSYLNVLRIKPDYSDAIYNLGLLYILKGDEENARKQAQKIKSLNPHFATQLEKLTNLIKK